MSRVLRFNRCAKTFLNWAVSSLIAHMRDRESVSIPYVLIAYTYFKLFWLVCYSVLNSYNADIFLYHKPKDQRIIFNLKSSYMLDLSASFEYIVAVVWALYIYILIFHCGYKL